MGVDTTVGAEAVKEGMTASVRWSIVGWVGSGVPVVPPVLICADEQETSRVKARIRDSDLSFIS